MLKFIFFSFNLFLDYNSIDKLTNYYHYQGDIVTFDNRLTAIGGGKRDSYDYKTGRKVEVYNKPNWTDTVIPSVGNYDHHHFIDFSTLSINKTLFVFGMNYQTRI